MFTTLRRSALIFSSGLLLTTILAPSLAAQRGLIALTKTKRSHFNAVMSPDGRHVAFQSVGKLGVVDIGGSKEIDLVTSNNIFGIVWAPSSSGVYYVDGSAVRFVARTGGKSILVQNVPGGFVQLWSVDAKDQVLFGSRTDSTAANRFVFTVATDGQSKPVDVLSSKMSMDEVMVDPTGKRFAYRRYWPLPFQPVELRIADVDGKNDASLTGKALSSSPQKVAWLDGGSTVGYTELNQSQFGFQVSSVTTKSSTANLITAGPKAHRNATVSSKDASWMVHEAFTNNSTWAVAVMPPNGGGRVMLEPETSLVVQGTPTIDAAGTVVAFAASFPGKLGSQVYAVKLDREVRVSPQVAVGKTSKVEFPVSSGESGILYMATALLSKPVQLGGFSYAVAVNPTVMMPILQGKGDGSGPLTLNVKVPNIAALKGFEVYLQGVRSSNGSTGDLTRYVEAKIF